jgi:hypothetical protein
MTTVKGSSKFLQLASNEESSRRERFVRLYEQSPIPEEHRLSSLPLFIRRQVLSRMLFFNELYQKIVNVHGIIMEFGVLWGQNLALLQSLRGIYEPFNHNRKIVGFDTFEGFTSVHERDGRSSLVKVGNYATTKGYEKYLAQVLDYHEQESPISHIKKYELVKGDASVQIAKYLKDNPETIVALAYFDMDMYEPTKKCLEAIRSHLTKGSVIGFDEINLHDFPGETQALKEVLGLDRYRIQRSPHGSVASYLVVE